jgi:formyltetrahydrofolate deformylase
MASAILKLSCVDQRGIVAQISQFIFERNGNIEHADQHIDSENKILFMRIQWALDNFSVTRDKIIADLTPLTTKFKMQHTLSFSDDIPTIAIFTSQQNHCLYDLLLRQQDGQLQCKIGLIISNHLDAQKIAKYFNIPFLFSPKNKKNKLFSEKTELAALKRHKIDTIVLARYMQILSKNFVKCYQNRIINIHHSFLPAFIGNDPYAQAYKRGVKIIGATSHYVTNQLDEGPIIEQNTARISHRDSLEDLKRKGKDMEKMVLSQALRWHLENKILIYNNKTVIFD